MDKEITTRWWRVARDEIPEGREAQIDWLFGWWQDIDHWVEEHKPKDLGPIDPFGRLGRRPPPGRRDDERRRSDLTRRLSRAGPG